MRIWISILILLAAPGAAAVDAEMAPLSSAAPALATAAVSPSSNCAEVSSSPAGGSVDPIVWAVNQRLPDGEQFVPPKADDRTLQLPEGPNALQLGLSALGSLGAFHACRSLKKLHLGAVPDWYHSGATQLGHVTPFDLASGAAALPLCVFDEPASKPAFSYRISREPCSRLSSQFFLPIEAPRGPPSCA